MRRNVTVGELQGMITELIENYGEEVMDVPIYASSDYGDHCHTQQLVDFLGLELHIPKKTSYSVTGLCIGEDTELWDLEQIDDSAVVMV